MRLRLDKFLSNQGAGTRKEVKEWILKGLVSVNGMTETSPKRSIDTDTDTIHVKDERLNYQQYVYYMLNKPDGVISATKDRRRTVIDCIKKEDLRKDLFPVGRLDRDTRGLLLLTNDGRLAHELLSPKKHVPKKYYVQLDKPLHNEDVRLFQEGFFLEPEKIHTLPALLEILGEQEALVTIEEGKYHQVKRMFHAVGKEVTYLKRVAMGGLKLDPSLEEGEYRPLLESELQQLKEL